MRKTARPVVWEGAGAQSPAPDPITSAQVQALNVDSPLLSQTAPGQFKLTIGVQKATRLTNFVAFPFVAPQTTVNGQGQLEFRFSAPDDAAFYRLEAH